MPVQSRPTASCLHHHKLCCARTTCRCNPGFMCDADVAICQTNVNHPAHEGAVELQPECALTACLMAVQAQSLPLAGDGDGDPLSAARPVSPVMA